MRCTITRPTPASTPTHAADASASENFAICHLKNVYMYTRQEARESRKYAGANKSVGDDDGTRQLGGYT